jgi:hypothetical protein
MARQERQVGARRNSTQSRAIIAAGHTGLPPLAAKLTTAVLLGALAARGFILLISVARLTATANRPDRRAPARPPSASVTARSNAVAAGVRRVSASAR